MGFFVWVDFSSRVFAGHFRVPGTPWNSSRKVKGSKAEPAAQLGQGWGAGGRPAWPRPLPSRAPPGADRSVELHSEFKLLREKMCLVCLKQSLGLTPGRAHCSAGQYAGDALGEVPPSSVPPPRPTRGLSKTSLAAEDRKTTGLLVYQLKAAPSWPQPDPLACSGTQTEAAYSGADSHPELSPTLKAAWKRLLGVVVSSAFPSFV